ncbi:hypothetical protein [Pseudomonas sp. RL]|uniref:hypothetical protein n=1 Tax=Pseudomonas sp. RL TaxID=1452718 RepID=UPI000486021E|nr:hypothetical protein [Pseudomonas sp. RL]
MTNKTHEELRKLLHANEQALSAAEEMRAQMAFAKAVRKIRTDILSMTQKEASEVLKMPQSQVARMESFSAPRGATFAQVERIISLYNSVIKKRDKNISKISLKLSIPTADGRVETICLAE